MPRAGDPVLFAVYGTVDLEHIRRFGPAGLFATEAFESFNAVIRAKSVHSNRQAPSRDIARAFAQANRIRHLLSGGLFMWDDNDAEAEPEEGSHQPEERKRRRPFAFHRYMWHAVGAGPLSIVRRPSTVAEYLGLNSTPPTQEAIGDAKLSCTFTKEHPPQPLALLKTGTHCPELVAQHTDQTFRTSTGMVIANGDSCSLGDFVLAKSSQSVDATLVGRVEEILTRQGSRADLAHEPDRATSATEDPPGAGLWPV
ncbi:hypothetical protein NUW54_g13893 [Trametes sanguinea]|uniref:Uncharacterized protein n=1 Tax=Trametes sanguinea TaxID=158606 RepID=A0ACC1MIP3_9APHY|nr:hypothetical protein NUW54_g13893 [Trametes sanguinea]